jgi:hypothetical protein
MLATVLSLEARMTYSFTQISQYLRCPASIATDISTDGAKKKTRPP